MFTRLAGWCHDRRTLVLALWLAALVLGGAAAGAVGDGFRDELNLPDVESQTGLDILNAEFGGQGAGQVGTIVFHADQGVDDPSVRAQMGALFDEVETIEGVKRVESPYDPGGERQISARGPRAGVVAFANVELVEGISMTEAGEIGNEISDLFPDVDGLRPLLGGMVFAEFDPPESELLGLAFAIVILIVAFGSVLAMGLPIGVALFGIGIGTAIITLLSNVTTIPDFATFLGVMIGLGVGIDYALLIVTRYRDHLHAGHPVRDAIGMALDTAGRSVLFAGCTVVISLLGLLVMGIGFVQGLAVAAASVVAVTIAASLTLLPALLGFAGTRIELTRRRGLIAAGLVSIALVGVGLDVTPLLVAAPLAVVVLVAGFAVRSLAEEVPRRTPKPTRETLAYRWSRLVQRHPWLAVGVGTLVLLVLAVPVLSLRLGFSDESNYAEETSTRQAYDLLVEGFGPGFNGPLLLAAELPAHTDIAHLEEIRRAAGSDPGVSFMSDLRTNDPDDPTAVIWTVVPTTGPQDEATSDLVDRLRTKILPPAEAIVGIDVAVTGMVAINVDSTDYLAERTPYFFAAVLTLSLLLLLLVFRSVLVPVKAVVMNLLSIAAAYGITVALFQWGWLSDLTGVQPAPIEPFIPMMLFAIVFGLSMDYEVFLLSRMREEWQRTGDSHTSVADGLAATAKVITAAAAIMVVVFGSFLLESDRLIKLFGTGLAVAILLDATIVRMLLVPATMELLGGRNWWLPRWLDRVLPTLDVEGAASDRPGEDDWEPIEAAPDGSRPPSDDVEQPSLV